MHAHHTLFALCLFSATVSGQTGGIVNGDFREGLKGWTTEIRGGGNDKGTVSAADGFAFLKEGASSLVSLQQVFRVPNMAPVLAFSVPLLGLDRTARAAADRIEISLVDPKTERSVVPTWRSDSQAFISIREGAAGFGPGVRLAGAIVLQDIRGLAGRVVRLRIDMVGGDDDRTSALLIGRFRPSGAGCLDPVLTKAPPNHELYVAANTAKEFEIEFSVENTRITKLEVDARGLTGLTWTPPKLGPRASIVARWTPDHSQVWNSPYPVRFSATTECTPATSASVTIQLFAVEVGCGLMLGGSRTNVDLGNGDYLLVNPALTYLITNQVPVFPIPNDRRLAGLRIFSQVFMGNQLNTKDPLMLSNGLEIVLGERAIPYGSDRFMRLGTRTVPKLGGKLEFDLAIR